MQQLPIGHRRIRTPRRHSRYRKRGRYLHTRTMPTILSMCRTLWIRRSLRRHPADTDYANDQQVRHGNRGHSAPWQPLPEYSHWRRRLRARIQSSTTDWDTGTIACTHHQWHRSQFSDAGTTGLYSQGPTGKYATTDGAGSQPELPSQGKGQRPMEGRGIARRTGTSI